MQRDRHVVTTLAAMLGNQPLGQSGSAAASNDGSGVLDARRAASNYLRRARFQALVVAASRLYVIRACRRMAVIMLQLHTTEDDEQFIT